MGWNLIRIILFLSQIMSFLPRTPPGLVMYSPQISTICCGVNCSKSEGAGKRRKVAKERVLKIFSNACLYSGKRMSNQRGYGSPFVRIQQPRWEGRVVPAASFYNWFWDVISLDFMITPPKVSSEGSNPVHTQPSEASLFLQIESTNTYRNVNGYIVPIFGDIVWSISTIKWHLIQRVTRSLKIYLAGKYDTE